MKVITLCGSTKFKEAFEKENARLTLSGYIVISVGVFGHADKFVFSDGEKEMLDDIHKRKIDMSDGIHVINVGGYIGSSTRSEIAYARQMGKTITYLESPKDKTLYIAGDLPVTLSEEEYNETFSPDEIRKLEGGESIQWSDVGNESHKVKLIKN